MRISDSRFAPTFELESAELALKGGPIAGIDEAGRGPWAGPVVAAAVVLDPDRIPPGIDDSKAMDEDQRETVYRRIVETSQFAVGIADVTRIDRAGRKAYARHMQMIFQDPYSSLNPRMTVGDILAEPFIVHDIAIDRAAREREIHHLLDVCGLPRRIARRFRQEPTPAQRRSHCTAGPRRDRRRFRRCSRH